MMTVEQFEAELEKIDADGSAAITAAKKKAEDSLNLQQEISQGVNVLKGHYAQKIDQLITRFVAESEQEAQ